MLLTIDQIKAIIDIVVLIAGFSIWRFTLAGTYVEEARKEDEKDTFCFIYFIIIVLFSCIRKVYLVEGISALECIGKSL